MLDAPGPWGTGPFTLVEGFSSIDNEQATISVDPFAATWLQLREDRTPRLRLVANTNYWDRARGPHVEQVVFRNDLTPADAIELVCTTEGEVDIVTEVPAASAARVAASAHASLIAADAMRAVVGIINRDAIGLPLADRRARQALNLATNRDQIVREAMFGYAQPLAGLTPPSAVTFMHRLSPYSYDPERAFRAWHEASPGGAARPLRLVAPADLAGVADTIAANLRHALGLQVDVAVLTLADNLATLPHLFERPSPLDWDIMLYAWSGQTTDAPALELHASMVGKVGGFRAGPLVPEFDELYEELVAETNTLRQTQLNHRLDKLVHEQALALFLCAPQALYAVNRQVQFTPYQTTFELAECRVSAQHWSRHR